MSKLSIPLTRLTLLTNIQPSSGDDTPESKRRRAEFMDLYNPVIERWCRRWGLREVEAEDLALRIIDKVLEKLGTYDSSKGRFRCWLKAVTRRAVIDHAQIPFILVDDGKHLDRLAAIVSSEALENLGEELDRATDPRIDLLPRAVELVRRRVEARTWDAFYANKVLGNQAEDVARMLGVKPSVVHNDACKVKNMLREEMQKLQIRQEGVNPTIVLPRVN